MKVLVQWIQANPSGWQEMDSSEWANVPFKADVTPSTELVSDNGLGWPHKINVQGVTFAGDHYAVEDVAGSGCKVTVWWDDARTHPVGERWAQEVTLMPLAPDQRLGGAINTKQSIVYYAENKARDMLARNGIPQNTTFERWNRFKEPDAQFVRHGKLMSSGMLDSLFELRESRGWREWTEHLDTSELDENGILKTQRSQGRYNVPSGTMTFYHRKAIDARGHATHTGILSYSCTLHADSITDRDDPLTVPNELGGTAFFSVTQSGLPGVAWPDGDYRHQLETFVADSTLTYGLLDQDTPVPVFWGGHFGRQPESADNENTHPTHQQAEAGFTLTGLKLATMNGSWGTVVDDATDRFEIMCSVVNSSAHGGDEAITIRINTTDAFMDGPWVEELDHLAVITGIYTTSYSVTTRFDVDAVEFVGLDTGVTYRSAAIFDLNDPTRASGPGLHEDAIITKLLLETYNVSVINNLYWTRIGGVYGDPSGDAPWTSWNEIGSGNLYSTYSSLGQYLNWAPEYLNQNAIDDLQAAQASGVFWNVGFKSEDEVNINKVFQFRARNSAPREEFREPRIWVYYTRPSVGADNAPYFGMNW